MISQQEILLFRSIKSEAIILILMLRMDKPTGETEISEILDMHPETVRSKLRGLARLGLITRTHHKQGYILTGAGSQIVLGATAENPRLEVSSITESLNKLNTINTVVIEGATAGFPRLLPDSAQNVENPVDNLWITVDKPEVWEELRSAGILPNERTRKLVARDFMTVDFVKGHKAELRKRGKMQPGLLITILETGLPAVDYDPPLRSSDDTRQKYAAWENTPDSDCDWIEDEQSDDPDNSEYN
jgi:DNA-binding MarR family transcriptional regulator